MDPPLVEVSPPPIVYRLAHRLGDPFAPPSWESIHEDGTFGNRFDDPGGQEGKIDAERFRVIYCATQRAGAFGETLARLRPSLQTLAKLGEEVEDDEPLETLLASIMDPEDHHRGIIRADWRHRRHVGETCLDSTPCFVDMMAAESIQHLRQKLAPAAAQLGLTDIDIGVLTEAQRRATQMCARYIYDVVDETGQPRFAGMRYLSRLNPCWECWAIFDTRKRHDPGFPRSIQPDDPDLIEVAKLYNLTIEVMEGHYLRPTYAHLRS